MTDIAGNPKEVDTCTRIAFQVQGVEYYLILGDCFCHIKIPNENDQDREFERELTEKISMAVTKGMKHRSKKL